MKAPEEAGTRRSVVLSLAGLEEEAILERDGLAPGPTRGSRGSARPAGAGRAARREP